MLCVECDVVVLVVEGIDVILFLIWVLVGVWYLIIMLVEYVVDMFIVMGWELVEGFEVEIEQFNFDVFNFFVDYFVCGE